MSYLLETLGRGLVGRLHNAFKNHLPNSVEDDSDALTQRQRDASTSFDLAIRLGSVHLREMQLSDARRAFERAGQLDGPKHIAAIGLACVHSELEQFDLTLRYLREAGDDNPHDPTVPFAIGLCQEQRGEPIAAIDSYEHALILLPQLRNAYERLAAIAVRASKWSEARECYARLAKLEPGDLDVLLTLAGLHLQEKDLQQAIETFQQALLIEPECAEETAELPMEAEDEGQLHQAIVTVEKLIDKYPGVTEFHVQLGDLYVKAGDDGGAVAQYRTALELHPSFLEATVKLGTQHVRKQRYDAAAREFNRAVELNDRLLTAFVGLGVAQHAAKREAEAKATFDLAASLAPNSTLLFSETNRLRLKSSRLRICANRLAGEINEQPEQADLLTEVLRRHQQVLLHQPGRADLHYRHGMLLRQMGNFEAAIHAFQQAAELHPSYAKALIKLGITHVELDQPAQAQQAFAKAIHLDEGQVSVHYQLGLLFAQRNRFELALDNFEGLPLEKVGGTDFRSNLLVALQNIGVVDRTGTTWDWICELTGPQLPLLGQERFSQPGGAVP